MTEHDKRILLDEMRQDMLEESKRDADHERYMRGSWEYALDHIDTETKVPLDEAVEAIRYAVKMLNEYGWVVGVNEVLDSY